MSKSTPHRPRLAAMLALFVVLAASAAASIDSLFSRARVDSWLDDQAAVVTSVVNSVTSDVLDDLTATAALVENVNPDSEMFGRFVSHIDGTADAIGVAYIDIVPAADLDSHIRQQRAIRGDFYDVMQMASDGALSPIDRTGRDTFYPVQLFAVGDVIRPYLSETFPEWKLGIGVDPGYDPAFRSDIEGAIAAGGPALSDFLAVRAEMMSLDRVFFASVPVRDTDGEITGLVAAPMVEPLLLRNVDSSILDDVEWEVLPMGETPTRADVDKARLYPIETLGATWSLALAPTDEAAARLAGLPAWVAPTGTGILATLIGLVLWLLLARRHELRRTADLQRVNDDKDRFLASVSHELRTPLTVVSGVSAELHDNINSFSLDEQTSLLGMLVDQTEELSCIVEDLLIAARSDIGKVVVHYDSIDPAEEVERTLVSTRVDATVSGVAGSAWADGQRVRQILRNLLSNARRYGGATIRVEISSGPGWVEVVVADDGDGIPEDKREEMFESYQSAHDHDRSVRSIGLGLYISRSLAEAMGGSLVYEHDGNWSRFRLRLVGIDAPAAAVPVTTV